MIDILITTYKLGVIRSQKWCFSYFGSVNLIKYNVKICVISEGFHHFNLYSVGKFPTDFVGNNICGEIDFHLFMCALFSLADFGD